MEAKIIKNILSDDEVLMVSEAINKELSSRPVIKQDVLMHGEDKDNTVTYVIDFGRIDIRYPKVPSHIIDKILNIVKNNVDDSFTNPVFDFLIYAEYSNDSGGNPRLRPHFDVSEASTVILDYQLESNISWEIDVESNRFTLKDNSGLLFDPLENIHSRPVRKFNDGEFVKMLFFRFTSTKPVVPKNKEDQFRLDLIVMDHDKEQEIKVGDKK